MPKLYEALLYQFGRTQPNIAAWRFNVSTDRLLIPTDIFDYNGLYVYMAWIMIITNNATNATLWGINTNGANNLDWFRTDTTGLVPQIRVDNGGTVSNATSPSAFSLETWYHCTVVREAVNICRLYVGSLTIPPTLVATNTTDVTGRIAPTRLEHGALTTSNNSFLNGKQAIIKAWSGYAMSRVEIVEEWKSITPVRMANLYGFWPGIPKQTALDFSGNRHTWLETGINMETPPPLTLPGLPRRLLKQLVTVYTLDASGSITPTGAALKQAQKAYAGQVGPGGTVLSGIQTALAGSITPVGTLIKQTGKALTGVVTATATLLKQIQTAYTGQTARAGEPDQSIATSFSGSITPAGIMARVVQKLVSGSITGAGAIIKQMATAYSGQSTPSGAPAQNIQTRLAGTVTPSGALTAIRSILLALSGAITPSGSLSRQVNKALSGAVSIAGEVVKQIGKEVSGSVTPVGALLKQVTRLLSGQISSSGALTTLLIPAVVVAAFRTLSLRTRSAALSLRSQIANLHLRRPDE